jgi:hypothetical protein
VAKGALKSAAGQRRPEENKPCPTTGKAAANRKNRSERLDGAILG